MPFKLWKGKTSPWDPGLSHVRPWVHPQVPRDDKRPADLWWLKLGGGGAGCEQGVCSPKGVSRCTDKQEAQDWNVSLDANFTSQKKKVKPYANIEL